METGNAKDQIMAERLASEVARDWVEGRNESIVARMSAEMAEGFPASELAKAWRSLTSQFGPCTDVGEAWTESLGEFQALRVPLTFGAQNLDLQLAIASGAIVGLCIKPRLEPGSRWRMPDYADAQAFDEIEVSIGVATTALPGTLTLPESASPVPVVVLIHGSGPRDRDESHGPNRPFRDLAAGLATRGVAVLRYDKRTKVHPQSFLDVKTPTVKEETIDDVLLAIAFLKQRPDIDARRIAIVGHSLGGRSGRASRRNAPRSPNWSFSPARRDRWRTSPSSKSNTSPG